MWNSLIGGIELFSDKKSFSVDVDTKTNLWLLMHFKHLEIKSKTLVYQVNKGIRQRKNTVYPIRKMRKKFKNTSELLEYIDLKPYDIYNLEIEFTNGWKIKQQPSVQFHFYTSSTKEELQVDVWLGNHPFYTDSQTLIDSEGRVERFMKKYGLQTKDN